jgi:hypothetical protein
MRPGVTTPDVRAREARKRSEALERRWHRCWHGTREPSAFQQGLIPARRIHRFAMRVCETLAETNVQIPVTDVSSRCRLVLR